MCSGLRDMGLRLFRNNDLSKEFQRPSKLVHCGYIPSIHCVKYRHECWSDELSGNQQVSFRQDHVLFFSERSSATTYFLQTSTIFPVEDFPEGAHLSLQGTTLLNRLLGFFSTLWLAANESSILTHLPKSCLTIMLSHRPTGQAYGKT